MNCPSFTAGVPPAIEADGLDPTQPRETPSDRRPPPCVRPERATHGCRPMGCLFGAWGLAFFPVWNPNGIPSRSPGLDREADLPWVNAVQCINPNGVMPPRRNPVGVVGDSAIPPRVARSSQPWALGRNPFGIGKCPPRTIGLGLEFDRFRRSGTLQGGFGPWVATISKEWTRVGTMNRAMDGAAPSAPRIGLGLEFGWVGTAFTGANRVRL